MSSRFWFWCAVVFLATAAPASAQAPSPLDLARGIREAGMSDLALEYLKEIEKSPLSDDDKKALVLERAKCLLEAAEDEPDEGTRTSMVGEAKDGFRDFLVKNAKHPRAAEASIALARLTSIDAKAQLNKAKRIEVGDDDKLKEEQRKESLAARPLFNLASKLFAEAAKQIKDKLADPALDPALRITLTREAFDAELASAINQYNLAGTYLATDAKTVTDRANAYEDARKRFAELAKGQSTSRTVWIAKAWMAETLMDQSKFTEGEAEFKAILSSSMLEASEGKRYVKFFQVRRNYFNALADKTAAKLQASERELKNWLSVYGGGSRPTPEALAARYYLAYSLQLQAVLATPTPKAGAPLVVGDRAKSQFKEAEKEYRILTQSDNDYTARAHKYRMFVVRMILGEADKHPIEYGTFEDAQMAALIQMAKLADAEKELPLVKARAQAQGNGWTAFRAEVKKLKIESDIRHRQHQIQLLLERAREIATDKDSRSDVVDNMLRLAYYYIVNNQPYRAAVLGEFMARTIKTTGGKSAHAGLLGMNGYLISSRSIKTKVDATDPSNKPILDAIDQARRGDRERAMILGRYLDEKFPNDTATDGARHRMASMLIEEKKYAEAFEMILKVRPGYAQITSLRLLEGYIANLLITTPAKDMPLPPGGKPFVFSRAIADLKRVAKPDTTAREEEVRDYFSVRARLAFLYLAQSRAEDKQADTEGPGYEKSLAIADEMIASVPTYDCFKEGDKLTVKGMEMLYLGLDARTRAVYLRGKALVDAGQDLDKAAAAIQPAIDDVVKSGAMFDDTMKSWQGAADTDPLAVEKAKVADLAKGIDRTRREIIMVGFKLRVRQGKPDDANKMLDLLDKVGGKVEENQSTFEFMARDLAAQIVVLKKEGKTNEANAMGKGLAILLRKLSTVPNLTPASILFLGQTLYLVDQYEDALKEFAKIQVPIPPNPGMFKITDKVIATLRGRIIPEAILAKITPLKNKDLPREEFEKELDTLLVVDNNLKWFKLTDLEIEELKKDKLTDPLLAKLAALKEKEFTRDELDKELDKLLSPEEKRDFKTPIMNRASLLSAERKKQFVSGILYQARSFKITDQVIATLQAKNVPEAVLAKLAPLKDELSREEFEKGLLAIDAAQPFQTLIMNYANHPSRPVSAPGKAHEWWKTEGSKLDDLDNNDEKKKYLELVRDYRPAQLFTARCYRGLNKLADAEKLLIAAIGAADKDKQGYAYASIDFRKELALVYEAKGAATADLKAANAEWKNAMAQWGTLFSFAGNEMKKLTPGDGREKEVKSRYFEVYLEIQRCLVQANTQLLKGNPKLPERIGEIGKKISDAETAFKFAELEKKGEGILTTEVWNHYCDLLDKYGDLKNAYKAAGGKFFLERPKE